ncbi:uncharacterized protein LOC108200816 isoform X3 [Daucus carota subsp. sativus]|uniref:uncharacterized protein LOC108200816 isoform X3 n=1 Tax=Daucus carota subsp. sativus TaxID=79200 RepID=UPI00308340C3
MITEKQNRMEGKMKEIEMKKMGLHKALLSLLAEWKDLQALLDFSTQNPCSKILQNEAPERDKLKEIDLNDGPRGDLAQVLETEGEKLVGSNEGLWDQKMREIKGKMREMEFTKGFIEERAKELELRERKIEDGFKFLEVKKMEIAEMSEKVDAKLEEIEEQKFKLKERREKLDSSEKEVKRVQVLCEQRFEEIVGKVREVDASRKYIETYAKELELKKTELDNGFKELELKNMEFTQKTNKFAAINFSNAEEYAKELELKQKELENGFKELESKKMEFAQKTSKFAAINFSNAEYAKEPELKQRELDNGFRRLRSNKMVSTQRTDNFAAIKFSNADINMNQTKRKRSSYDLRCRAPARTEVPAPQVCQTVIIRNSDSNKETFWTCCTSCKFKFMYHRNFVNKILRCRKCSKNFTGYELDAESIPSAANIHSIKQMELSAKTNKIADFNMNQINDSESNHNRGIVPKAESVDCPYPEFSDFDKQKDENCFSVDQIWACYDSLDVMPILYGHIRKVFSPDFKLQVTFLKADPEEQNKINWVKAGLPMVCGKFIHDDTIETSKRLMFSHQMHIKKGSDDGTYLIYPRKGETWALFKDWNIGWSSDPSNHRTFKYVMVEILSDFKQETGVEICYLAKVKGFVSVFRRVAKDGIVTFPIPSSEMLRFAYNVPSTKLTGAEREGVPAGAFELDPASLPTDPNKLCQPEDREADT